MARKLSLREAIPGLRHMLVYFWPWIRKEKAGIFAALIALFLGILLRLAEPWPLKFVIDRVLPSQTPGGTGSLPILDQMDPATLLLVLAISVVVIRASLAVTTYLHKVGFARVGTRVLLQVRNLLYSHLQRLSLSFHTRARGGDLTVRVTRDVSMLRDVTSTALIPLLANLLILIGMAAVMLYFSWQLTLIAAATAPLYWFSTVKIGQGIHKAARKQREREGVMAANAAESMSAIKTVQAMSLEQAFAKGFSHGNESSQKQDLKTTKLAARLELTVDILLAIATAMVLWYGARLVLDTQLSTGDLTVFLVYLRRAFKPAKDFAKYTARLAKAAAAGERVLAILEEVPEVQNLPGAVAAPKFDGAVRYQGLSYGYDADHPVLRKLDLSIPAGQSVAIVGPSGIGKSTLAGLLLRLYDPQQGRVCIDDTDIRDYTLETVRGQISVVMQDTVLFAATIAENIAFGVDDATPAQIEVAARLANADQFIRALPDGYDTEVGERGATLSNGQRQRISIARAAMRNSPILILDEPTTGLDEANEREVMAALSELARGRTTILITHDLRAATRMDLVMLLDHGQIAEQGTPEQLLAARGKFREQFDLQTKDGTAPRNAGAD